MFFNIFQYTRRGHQNGKGDCDIGFEKIFDNLRNNPRRPAEWDEAAFGLGAWGTPYEDYNQGKISIEDKQHCINSIKQLQESGDYPEMKASIYFNSLMCRIDEERNEPLLDTFNDYMRSDAFYEHDLHFSPRLSKDKGGHCNHECDSRCHWSYLPWDREATGAPRCNPRGFEYTDEIECGAKEGACIQGCPGSSCAWSWPWDDASGAESEMAKCRCRPKPSKK